MYIAKEDGSGIEKIEVLYISYIETIGDTVYFQINFSDNSVEKSMICAYTFGDNELVELYKPNNRIEQIVSGNGYFACLLIDHSQSTEPLKYLFGILK